MGNRSMTALAVGTLEAIRAAGGEVRLVAGQRLKIVAPVPLPDELIERARAAKPALLALLSQEHVGLAVEPAAAWPTEPAAALADADERAEIIEYDGGAPREWAEARARLDPARPPADVPQLRWLQFIDDCGRFLDDGWAARAAALGWEPLELFGCDRKRPLARHDHAGLLWLLHGRCLLALTADAAIIETATGARQTYYRQPAGPRDVVLAWELRE
jgi:hypothetical protein